MEWMNVVTHLMKKIVQNINVWKPISNVLKTVTRAAFASPKPGFVMTRWIVPEVKTR